MGSDFFLSVNCSGLSWVLCAVGLTLAGSLENFYFLDEIGSVQGGMTLNRALNFF